ncbi:UNVERIFIED_CONTAM: DNA (cytosine-5)-methyltransferase CMT3 [Sesamum angustifolium]|uniref:DNA (cytosine-5-)-methyltransferase n=1 Tax=Sesamum angustifolium TaxID=2727405 RepID=A0AAW2PV82_9LAMI
MGRGRKRAEVTSSPSKPSSSSPKKLKKTTADDGSLNFVGAPVPADEAQSRWPHRYQSKSKTATILVTLSDGSTEEKEFFQARCHYTKATVDGVVFNLFDDAYIQASEGEPDFIAKIVEMFETVSKETYICAQWFYRAKDTVVKDQDYLIDTRRVFYSDMLYLILATNFEQMDIAAKEKAKNSCDLYVDMMYTFPHAFTSLYIDNENSSVTDGVIQTKSSGVAKLPEDFQQSKRTVLDLYSGCGAMSSGLSIGASLAGENITTRWTVDFNSYACESLKSNHPNVEVRNEDAEDFFVLLKEWESLCKEFNLLGSKEVELEPHDIDSDESEVDDCLVVPSGEFEVEKLIAICYGDPNNVRKRGLHFKVILHPYQDRVLSVRENARLQGFPDCYKLYGPIKERYMQVGNAVSFSVSIPLGYCLAKAMQGASSTTPLTIPFQFPDCLGQLKSARQESELDAVAFAG